MAKQVPLDEPWKARRAAEWDARSVASYLEQSGIRSAVGRDLFDMAVRGLFTGDLNDTSFLHLLFLVRAHGSINNLFSIEGGSQENMVDGGAGSIAQRVAAELGDAVRLEAPVRSITQDDDARRRRKRCDQCLGPARGRRDPARADARHRVRSRTAGRSHRSVPQGRRRSREQDARRLRRAVLAGRRFQRTDGRAQARRRRSRSTRHPRPGRPACSRRSRSARSRHVSTRSILPTVARPCSTR